MKIESAAGEGTALLLFAEWPVVIIYRNALKCVTTVHGGNTVDERFLIKTLLSPPRATNRPTTTRGAQRLGVNYFPHFNGLAANKCNGSVNPSPPSLVVRRSAIKRQYNAHIKPQSIKSGVLTLLICVFLACLLGGTRRRRVFCCKTPAETRPQTICHLTTRNGRCVWCDG